MYQSAPNNVEVSPLESKSMVVFTASVGKTYIVFLGLNTRVPASLEIVGNSKLWAGDQFSFSA